MKNTPSHSTRSLALSSAALLTISVACVTAAKAAGQQPAAVPFDAFVTSFQNAHALEFVRHPGNRVASETDFDAMRAHLSALYAGIDVRESYTLGGRTFDCVRYDQQPGVRIQGLDSIASPPSISPEMAFHHPAQTKAGAAQLPATFDSVKCHAGTFPLPRVTLDELAKFGTLHDYFSKGPNGTGEIPLPEKRALNSGGHAYAYAYQYVTNAGSYANQGVFSPAVVPAWGEVFSLQQQWTIGFGSQGTQTAEVGAQVYPGLYGTSSPVLFAYFTGDGYANTHTPLNDGCYNYSCGAFVQYSGSSIYLQSTLSPVSVVGGAQYYISDGYYLYNGNWWLGVQGQWVGYYPQARYTVGGSGGLVSASTLWEVGTESVGSYYWPAEGSGQWASRGWPYASYFRNMVWRDTANGGHTPGLTSVAPSPSCYSITNQAYGGSAWAYYLFLGGPGGYGC